VAARLPVPGDDKGIWGTVLNDFLLTTHKTTGELKDGVVTSTSITDGAIPQAKITNLVSDLAAKASTSAIPTTPAQVGAEPAGLSAGTIASVSALSAKALTTGVGLWIGTQAQYNAISTPDPLGVYVIKAS